MAHLATNAPAVRSGAGTNASAPAELREVKPPVPIPFNRLWLWLLAVPLLGLLILAAVLFFARRHRLRHQPPTLLVIPPHTRARNGLRHALEMIGQPKPFCTAVSHVLRLYLEERFQFHAPDRTTDEFLDEAQASPLLALSQKQALADFLTRCDLVKFARGEPAEPELRDLWHAAERLIDETAPETVVAAGAPAAQANPPPAGSPG